MCIQQIEEKLYNSRIGAACLCVISAWGLIDVWDDTTIANTAKFIIISWAQALFFCFFTKQKKNIIRIGANICIALICILSCIGLYCYHYWNFGIGGRILILISDTNATEAKGFALTMLSILPHFLKSWHFISLITCIIVFVAIVWRIPKRAYSIAAITIFTIGTTLAAIHIITTETTMGKETGKKNVSILLRTGHDFYTTQKQLNIYNKLKENISFSTIDSATITSEHLADNIILLIGESSNCTHWSLYGYPLPTTPRLYSMRDSFITFTNVIPPYGSTAAALTNVLSVRNTSNNTADWSHYGSIIGIAKHAAYDTYWISNQWRNENIVNVIASEANHEQYVKQQYHTDYDRLYFDEEMFPIMNNALANSNTHKFIMMHCAGSHFQYKHHAPDRFKLFNANDIPNNKQLSNDKLQMIADYDNAILYTDYIISTTIETLQADTTHSNIMIYLSDHSEDLYDTDSDYFGHATKPYQQIHIPMIAWANKKYKQQHSKKWSAMQQNSQKPFDSENLIYTLLGLTGTNYNWYVAEQDLSSDKYEICTRYFEGKQFDN